MLGEDRYQSRIMLWLAEHNHKTEFSWKQLQTSNRYINILILCSISKCEPPSKRGCFSFRQEQWSTMVLVLIRAAVWAAVVILQMFVPNEASLYSRKVFLLQSVNNNKPLLTNLHCLPMLSKSDSVSHILNCRFINCQLINLIDQLTIN